jgi:hypothetical protein
VVSRLESVTEPYKLIATATLWSIHIVVLARSSVADDISGMQVTLTLTLVLARQRCCSP